MRILLLVLIVLIAGCASEPSTTGEKPATADFEFQKLADEYIAGYLACRPQTGTALGFHQYDGKLTDYSQRSLAAELDRLKSFEQRLSVLRTGQLGSQAYYDCRILRNAIQREIFGFEQMQVYTRNPMLYAGAIDANVYIKRNFAPLEERVRSLIEILKHAPAVFSAARMNLADVLPRPQVELAIDQGNGAVDFLSKDLVEAVKEVKDEKLLQEFTEINRQAVNEFSNYVAYLKQEKLPKANEDYALGREKYRKLLEYGEMVHLSPEELLEIGMRELRKKQQVFAEAARQIDPAKKPVEVFQAIQKDHPTGKSLIPDTARDLESIRQFLIDKKIITLPSPVRARVLETPKYLRATGFASMDTPGPFETKATEAYYYVTPPEPDWTEGQKEEWLTAFNYYTTDIVSVHEAYPGHYVQYLCLNASPATKLEKIFVSYAFSEGWAHYAEQMMVDEGFALPDSPASSSSPDGQARRAKYLLAQTDEALLRLCRMCVSIRMHCQGMKVDEATKFFQENCYYEQKPAHQEAMRGAYDPEYLYYTLGKLQIMKLREDYRRQEGTKFSLLKFHDQMLRNGAPPVRLLRERLLKNQEIWDQVLQ